VEKERIEAEKQEYEEKEKKRKSAKTIFKFIRHLTAILSITSFEYSNTFVG
jgi:hypothetical protein